MTSAHRPTWAAALGGSGLREGAASAPTFRFSARDLRAHTKLKFRQPAVVPPSEDGNDKQNEQQRFSIAAPTHDEDEDLVVVSDEEEEEKEVDERAKSNNSDSVDLNKEEEDEADETAELMRELEKIKRERAAEEAKRAREREAQMATSNPLLAGRLSMATPGIVKRRWTDDTVFKNQARGLEENPTKRFINDTTRSDFHRRFLQKYIR